MPADHAPRASVPRRVAALMLAVQVLALVVISVLYLVGLAGGASDSPARVLTSVVLMLVFAAGLGLLARGILRGASWAPTPAGLWQALLLPIAWGLFQSGQSLIGLAVLVVSVVGLVSLVLAARTTPGD